MQVVGAAPRTMASERLFGLDALRSVCMLYGLFLHAQTVSPSAQTVWISVVSDHFRMATFFAVSAYLGAIILKRRSASQYVGGRAMAICLPLVSTLVLVNPMTFYLILQNQAPHLKAGLWEATRMVLADAPALEGITIPWHLHLWFLISLLIYATLLPSVAMVASLASVNRAFAPLDRLPVPVLVVGIACLVVGVSVALRIAFEIAAPFAYDTWLIRATLIYLPFFLLGAALTRISAFDRAVTSVSWSAVGLALLVFLFPRVIDLGNGALAMLITFAGRAFVTAVFVMTLFAVFLRFAATPNPVMTVLTRAIYTVYLFHYLLVHAAAAYLMPKGIDGPLLLVLCAVFALVAGLAIHYAVIARISVARLLFNGRR